MQSKYFHEFDANMISLLHHITRFGILYRRVYVNPEIYYEMEVKMNKN